MIGRAHSNHKKRSLSATGTCVLKGGQAGSNRRPPDPQSGETTLKLTKPQRVAKRRSRRDTNGDTCERENEHGAAVGSAVLNTAGGSVATNADTLPIKADSFSAALAMIASLPLSDAEKAEAVRRLLAERAGSPKEPGEG